jgi:hypothetical protein
MIDLARATLDVDAKDIRHELECALREAIDINKEAKGLSYPVVDIQVKLSNLAEKHGLEDEMEYCLDYVNEQSNKLQSAFFECESVFEEAISELELEEDYD